MRILIADDNVVNRLAAQMLVGKMGYRAEVAENGREVLEKMRTTPYDLLLLDLSMPELDGLETAWEIRRRFDSGRQPCIYALTAGTSPEDEARCRAAGMDGCLLKPLRAGALRTLLASLSNPTLADELPPIGPPVEGALLFQHPHIADLFLRDAPQKIAAMREALAAHDADRLRRSAHALKGSGYTVGARTMAGACEQIEEIARSDQYDFEPVEVFLDSVEKEFERLRLQLEGVVAPPMNLSPASTAGESRPSLR